MKKFDTRCVQDSWKPEKSGDPRVLPLYQSTTFYYEKGEDMAHIFDNPADAHLYTRISNPTSAGLEAKVASLEDGVAALAAASGMAATVTAILTLAGTGDNILAAGTIYGGTYNLFNVTFKKIGIEVRFFDPDAPTAEIEKLVDSKTKAIFAESIANPAMTVVDLEKLAGVAKKYGVVFMLDNTLTTPYILRPKKYGVNVIIHSSTKYLDGHASCVGGVVVDCGNFEFLNNPRYSEFNLPDASYHGVTYAKDCGSLAFIFKARAQMMRDLGNCISPFNAYLTNLGTETLHLRMRRHSENALAVAEFLNSHKNVDWVKYPGLKTDKYHNLANKYFEPLGCYSGMIAFGASGGRAGANEFMKRIKLFNVVTHIADVRSCVLHPATTTHRQLSDADLVTAGIADNLVRLSVGIEDAVDLIEDLRQALEY